MFNPNIIKLFIFQAKIRKWDGEYFLGFKIWDVKHFGRLKSLKVFFFGGEFHYFAKKNQNSFFGVKYSFFFSKFTKNQKKSGKSPSRDSLTCHLSLFFKLQKKWYLISSNQVILLKKFIILFGLVVFCSFKFHHVGSYPTRENAFSTKLLPTTQTIIKHHRGEKHLL